MAVVEHVEERPDLQISEQGVAEMGVPVDLIPVAAALFDPHEKALINEVSHDLLGGALADSDACRDLADPDRGFASDADKHVPWFVSTCQVEGRRRRLLMAYEPRL